MGSTAKPWVDGPFKLIDPSKSGDAKGKTLTGLRSLAAGMSKIHNCIFRGANAIYIQAANVSASGTAQDKSDFVNFAYQWALMLEEHHDGEEEVFFPEMNEKAGVPGLMDGNVAEHAVFHDGLVAYKTYLEGVRAKKEEFDGEKLKGIMDGFMPDLQTHLHNEIDTLVDMVKYEDKCDWVAWFESRMGGMMREHMKSGEYRTTMAPLVIIFHDKTYMDGIWAQFPPIPWLVGFLMRLLWLKKYDAWWRFAGCDLSSMPKELPFA